MADLPIFSRIWKTTTTPTNTREIRSTVLGGTLIPAAPSVLYFPPRCLFLVRNTFSWWSFIRLTRFRVKTTLNTCFFPGMAWGLGFGVWGLGFGVCVFAFCFGLGFGLWALQEWLLCFASERSAPLLNLAQGEILSLNLTQWEICLCNLAWKSRFFSDPA